MDTYSSHSHPDGPASLPLSLPLAVQPRPICGYKSAMETRWRNGFIFTCRTDTFLENFQHGVFGMPAHKLTVTHRHHAPPPPRAPCLRAVSARRRHPSPNAKPMALARSCSRYEPGYALFLFDSSMPTCSVFEAASRAR